MKLYDSKWNENIKYDIFLYEASFSRKSCLNIFQTNNNK